MKRQVLMCLCLMSSLCLCGAPAGKNGIPGWRQLPNLGVGSFERLAEDGVSFMRLSTMQPMKKQFMSNNRFIEAEPGSQFVLKVRVRTDIEAKGGARAGVNFLTADQKRPPIKNYSTYVYCGGNRDWTELECAFTIPEKAEGFQVIACIYQAKGSADFTDFRLFDEKGEPIPIHNPRFELKPGDKTEGLGIDEIPEDAVWNYNFKIGRVGNTFFFTGLHLGAELVQFDSPTSLAYLPAEGEGRSKKAMSCTLCSTEGSSYWRLCNISTFEQTYMWSNEAIPLEGGLKKVAFPIPFTTPHPEYHCALSKGAYAFRGHHYFRIMEGDKYLGSAQQIAVDAQISPEAGFFGESRSGNPQPMREGLFTLANLSSFQVDIVDFRSTGKPGGEYAFRLELTDADGARLPVNRAHSIAVEGADSAACSPLFDRYSVPTGWFVGRYGKELPKELGLSIAMRASTAAGIREVVAKGRFGTAATASPIPVVDQEPFCIRPDEARSVCLPRQALPPEEAEGLARVKFIIDWMKRAHLKELMPFAIGNRCEAIADLGNPYMVRPHSWDVFRVLREETEKAGIRLSGLVCLLPEGAERPKGFLKEHPEFAMTDSKGELTGWMDPAVPEVHEYRVRDIVTLAKKYRLDGVQLDYARLNSRPSQRGAELYMEKFGKDPRTFVHSGEEYKHWFAWESENLTNLVREIRAALKAECPQVKLSAYVQGSRYRGERLWNEDHQPYGKWLREGLLDVIAPTGYIYDMLQYRCWVKRQVEYCRAHNPAIPIHITVGVQTSHGRIEDLKELVDQIDYANRLGADGAEFFQWMGLEPFLEGLSKTRYTAP